MNNCDLLFYPNQLLIIDHKFYYFNDKTVCFFKVRSNLLGFVLFPNDSYSVFTVHVHL